MGILDMARSFSFGYSAKLASAKGVREMSTLGQFLQTGVDRPLVMRAKGVMVLIR